MGKSSGRAGRVLLCVHSASKGGAERMAVAEAELLERDRELVVSVPDGPLRADFESHGRLVAGVASIPLWGASPRRWAACLVRTALDALRLARELRRSDIDVVLTNSSVLLAPVLAARLAGRPVVVHVRESVESRLAGAVFTIHRWLASTVVVVDRDSERWFGAGRKRGARIAMIHDGVELADRAVPARRPFGATLRLCLVGALDVLKGQDLAVEALGALGREGMSAELTLVGREIDPAWAEGVRARARALGVEGRVRFAGELPDISGELSRADVLIAPSRAERTPLSIMEAMVEGIPVVAASVGGVPELVLDRRTGWLIPPEDPDALALALLEVARDPAHALTVARGARAHLEAEFSLARTLDGVRGEVDRLLERRAAA